MIHVQMISKLFQSIFCWKSRFGFIVFNIECLGHRFNQGMWLVLWSLLAGEESHYISNGRLNCDMRCHRNLRWSQSRKESLELKRARMANQLNNCWCIFVIMFFVIRTWENNYKIKCNDRRKQAWNVCLRCQHSEGRIRREERWTGTYQRSLRCRKLLFESVLAPKHRAVRDGSAFDHGHVSQLPDNTLKHFEVDQLFNSDEEMSEEEKDKNSDHHISPTTTFLILLEN